MSIHPSLFNLCKPNTVSNNSKRNKLTTGITEQNNDRHAETLKRVRKPRGPTREFVKPSYITSKSCMIVPIQDQDDIQAEDIKVEIPKQIQLSSKLHNKKVYHGIDTETNQQMVNYDGNPGIVINHKTIPENLKLIQSNGKSYFDIEYNGWCWHDCHVFDTKPVGCPIHYEPAKKRMMLLGFFCSFECALAWGIKNVNSFVKSRLGNLIIILRKTLARSAGIHLSTDQCHVTAAENNAILKVFGGWMEINEYRKKYCSSIQDTTNHLREYIVCQAGLIQVVPASLDHYTVDKSQYISKFSETPLSYGKLSDTPMRIANSDNATTSQISRNSLDIDMQRKTLKKGKATHILDYKQPMHSASIAYQQQENSVSTQNKPSYNILMQTLGVHTKKRKKN